MKHSLIAVALTALTACGKTAEPVAPAAEHELNATSKTEWHYYSFPAAAEVPETGAWDIAVQRLNIRTKNGVYIFDKDQTDAFGNITPRTKFEEVTAVPANAQFDPDREFTSDKMGGGTETVVRSEAVVVQMWRGAQGPIMPPDYRPAPPYLFQTSDGCYKVQFTQYKNEANEAGHVKFIAARIR